MRRTWASDERCCPVSQMRRLSLFGRWMVIASVECRRTALAMCFWRGLLVRNVWARCRLLLLLLLIRWRAIVGVPRRIRVLWTELVRLWGGIVGVGVGGHRRTRRIPPRVILRWGGMVRWWRCARREDRRSRWWWDVVTGSLAAICVHQRRHIVRHRYVQEVFLGFTLY